MSHPFAIGGPAWNCEHRVWDDADGDDFFCHALEPSHYAVIEAPEI